MPLIELKEVQCGVCGTVHAIPEAMWSHCHDNGGYWHCPNGHQWGYREGAVKRDELRRERDRLKQRIAQKDDEIARERQERKAAERRVSAAKGQITKLKNRAKAGVCPCCNRTFQNLQRHMATKHPDFEPKVVDLDDARKASA